jgi:hypothetical protein
MLIEEEDWPEETALGAKLSEFEESLFCTICRGLFDNPQMLRCGHSYCSICIQKHFDKTMNRNTATSEACPSCRTKAELFDLKPNRSLAAVVAKFSDIRNDLLLVAKSDLQKELTRTSNSANQTIKKFGKPLGGTVIVKRMPHYSFFGLSKEKIKKIMEDVTNASKVKLRLDGDKEVLERRMRELMHLANAQVDALKPMSLDEVIYDINSRETARDAEAKKALRTVNNLETIRSGKVCMHLQTFDYVLESY